jgi:hypothetical protein
MLYRSQNGRNGQSRKVENIAKISEVDQKNEIKLLNMYKNEIRNIYNLRSNKEKNYHICKAKKNMYNFLKKVIEVRDVRLHWNGFVE